ncbi:lipid droplet-regulating VLDL assembly factor AUP1-like isoform X2 [Dysidea avara]|uniref:lipid droplet-regulating VLDL assembly factor AUP1-like isoform X2 n=1 Tax=Dysidea avara TaxID=196820 RepID=UPI00332150B8
MADRGSELQELNKALNRTRLKYESWLTYFAIFYVPIGLLLLLLRLCIGVQVLLLLLLVPDRFPWKRGMLRVMFTTLGIVVSCDHKGHNPNAKVYPSSDQLLTPTLLPYQLLVAKDDETCQREVTKVTNSLQIIAQPEATPTNGSHALLKYRMWPFVLDKQVQPVVIETQRPLNVAGLNITTVTTYSPVMDLLSCMYCPVTVFRVRFLPVISCHYDESVEQFTIRTQQVVGSTLHLTCTQLDGTDVDRWIRPSATKTTTTNNVPFIPISHFNKMLPQDPQLEVMLSQVRDVLPHISDHVIRRDLMLTRDVDKTITNVLEGKIQFNEEPDFPQATTSSAKPDFSNLSFPERKAAFLEEARRRFILKHGHS